MEDKKQAKSQATLGEVRQEIDALDAQIQLLARSHR